MLDEILSTISLYQHSVVEDSLSNDEVSSDDEMFDYFLALGMSEEQSRRALKYRSLYLNNIFQPGATPILKGAECYRFNPVNGMCERFDPKV